MIPPNFPRWDYTLRPIEDIVFMDIETQSTADLKEMGSYYYLTHPTTRIMSTVFLHDKTAYIWVPAYACPKDLEHETIEPVKGFGFEDYETKLIISNDLPSCVYDWYHTKTWVAHNAEQFDSIAWKYLVPSRDGIQPRWYDTINAARAASLYGSIDKLGTLYFNHGKSEEGKRSMMMLSKAKVKKEKTIYNVGTVHLWKMMLRYNLIDVLIMRHVYNETLEYPERDVLDVHSEINQRGIYIDRKFLDFLWQAWGEVEAETYKRISELTGGKLNQANIRNTNAIKAWLEKAGLRLDCLYMSLNKDAKEQKISIAKNYINAFYDAPEDFIDESVDDEGLCRIMEVLKLRSMANRTSKAKLTRMMLSVSKEDGRLRNMFAYHQAVPTGRWAGKGVQPHNLAKGHSKVNTGTVLKLFEEDKLTLEAMNDLCQEYSLSGEECRKDDLLTTVLRPVFCAEKGNVLGFVDYGSIEGRGVAWVADERWLLAEFAKPNADVYIIMASDIYGREITKDHKDERQVGKITVLGCGYNMGPGKFKVFCETTKPKVDLVKAGTTADICIKKYRAKNPNICRLWKLYELAALDAIRGTPRVAGKCRFFMRDHCLNIQLPNGKRLIYRAAEITREVPQWALLRGIPCGEKDTIKYRHTYGNRKTIYGGLITENIVQSISSMLLRESLLRLQEEGIPVVGHVHDEILIEVPENRIEHDLKVMAEIMSETPDWAKGFPIAVEGHANRRYVKTPMKGDYVVEALGGTVTKFKTKDK
jgi:DNA polymerase